MNMKQKILSQIQKVRELSKWQRLFILFAMLCSFCITAEASITKPVSNSLFIAAYGVKSFPFVWLSLVPLNFLIVHLYNRYVSVIGPFKTLICSMAIAMSLNIFCFFYLDKIYCLPFILYLWKDVYILLMFQQLWAVIHATINIKQAKYLYGIFYGMGGIGCVFGSTVPGFFAIIYGSQHLLLATLPFYLLMGIFYYFCLKVRDAHPHYQEITFKSKKSNFAKGVSLIGKSKYLQYILLLVIFMQVASTLLDFNFNALLETHIPDKDLRTQFIARFFGAINTLNIFLQFIGAFALVHMIGLKNAHLAIPIFLGACLAGSIAMPIFPLIALSFGAIKSLDYSIFGIIKEMLYVPVSVDEKFHAKSVIDVFFYRSSKALASLMILVLQALSIQLAVTYVSYLTLAIFVIWALSTLSLFKHYQKLANL